MLEALVETLRLSLANMPPWVIACWGCCPPILGATFLVWSSLKLASNDDDMMNRG